jgi:hypothetical protein
MSFPIFPPSSPIPPPIAPAKVPIRVDLRTSLPLIFSPVKAQLVNYETAPDPAPPTADALT